MFVLRKLHSLTGVVPVGCFVVLHLWTNARAIQGQQAFEDAYATASHIPDLLFFEIVFVLIPLLFHAAYGIKIALTSRPRLGKYPTTGNWGYVMQRVTGGAVLLFVGVHLYELRGRVALGTMNSSDYFPELCSSLSSTVAPGLPLHALFYLTGMAAAVYHLSYGLYSFCFSWGITGSRRASNRLSVVFGLLGLLLFVLGATTIIYFATGSRLVLSWSGRDPGQTPISCEQALAARTLPVFADPGPGRSPSSAAPSARTP